MITYARLNPALPDGVRQADSPGVKAVGCAKDQLSNSYTFIGTTGWRSPQLIAVVKAASLYTAEVRIRKDAHSANGKSFLELLTLGVKYGDKLTIHTIGHAASEALVAVAALPFFAPTA